MLPGGITPACAGKREIVVLILYAIEDHPRVCGEKILSSRSARPRAGSPPRVRGKVDMLLHLRPEVGITPACAGKSPDCPAFRRSAWDHPRVCGEKKQIIDAFRRGEGSPPRVRGKVEWRYFLAAHTGITPACAGKSKIRVRANRGRGDHPRVCGEKSRSTTKRRR